jgi:hypothetical protein
VEFCNTLVCCPNREPSIHPKELINLDQSPTSAL